MSLVLLKRWLVGPPMPLAQARHERLRKPVALAVFSSDAMSSVAYATEEILLVLVLAGAAAMHLSVPIALAITALLVVVVISYQQTIHAYPSGGGSYIVAKENLGAGPGLVAAAALLVDYVLTVSVSVAAGVAAITSALPALSGYRVVLGVICIGAIAFANIRGSASRGACSPYRPTSSSCHSAFSSPRASFVSRRIPCRPPRPRVYLPSKASPGS